MRIGIDCHDFETLPRWGIGRHIEYLLKTIAEYPEFHTGNEFYLYFKHEIPNETFLEAPFFKKKALTLIRPSFTLYYNFLLPVQAHKDSIDVMFFPANMLPLVFKGKSIVQLPIDVFYEIKHGSMALRHKIGYKVLSTWAAKKANRITTNSQYSKDELVKLLKIKDSRVVVNPLGIDPKKFYQDLSMPKGNFILNVGQCFPRRRTKEIIEAFTKLQQESTIKDKKLRLIIIGKDKYRPAILDNLIKIENTKLGYNGIVRLDSVNDQELIELYRQAKLLLYISSSEAQGLPPMEALACGTPPVVADNTLSKEIFDESAFFVQHPDKPKSIQETLRDALENTKKQIQISENAKSMTDRFTWYNHVRTFLETADQVHHNRI